MRFFSRPSAQLLTLDMIKAECRQLPDFPVINKSTLRKWCEKPEFCYEQAYQQFDVDNISPACNFIKNEIAAQFLHPVT